VHWLRLMYAYPSCFTDEMIKTIAGQRAGREIHRHAAAAHQRSDPHVDRRRGHRKEIDTLLNKLRKWVPGIAIRTTFIAGTPGETDAQHKELVKFVRDFGFDMMGVFPYSREPGTPMAKMDGRSTTP
jgi:ribosomal protein S12 methylthiotransferase